MASGNFFAPVEHDVDDALVHGFLNGGMNDAFDFEFNGKNRKSPKYADVDFGTGRHNQSNQGSKGSTSKSLRGGGGLSSRHVKFDLGKTSFIDPNPFEALDALMGGGSGSNESSLSDFSGGGRISNCASNPSYKWTPGQKTPQGLGFCPDDFKPGHVMRAYDGEYRVGVDRNGKKGWVPNSVPVYKYSKWDINPFTWPHHGIDHLLCCGNGVPKGTTLTATPAAAASADDAVKKAEEAADKAKKAAEAAQAALVSAQAEKKKAEEAKTAADAAAFEKTKQVVQDVVTEINKVFTEISNAIVQTDSTKLNEAVAKLKTINTAFGGGELVGGGGLVELQNTVKQLFVEELTIRANVVSAIKSQTPYDVGLSTKFPDKYKSILDAMNRLAQLVKIDERVIIPAALQDLHIAFEAAAKAKAAADAQVAADAKAAAEAAKTAAEAKAAAEAAKAAEVEKKRQLKETARKAAAEATASIRKAQELKRKLTDIQNTSEAADAQLPTESGINDDELKRNVQTLLTAVKTAQNQVVEHFNTKQTEAKTTLNAAAIEAQKASLNAIIETGNALQENAGKKFPIQPSIDYLKQVADYCKNQPCRADVLQIIKQINGAFHCNGNGKSSPTVKAICNIAADLSAALLVEQPQQRK